MLRYHLLRVVRSLLVYALALICFLLFLLQAFLEMAEEGAAISMVNYFSSGTSAQLRGRNVFVQYSNHTQLKTDQSHSNAVIILIYVLSQEMPQSLLFRLIKQSAAAQAALQAAQALAGQTETQGGPNTVLRVIVEHMVYPVTLDVLFQVTILFSLSLLPSHSTHIDPSPMKWVHMIQLVFDCQPILPRHFSFFPTSRF